MNVDIHGDHKSSVDPSSEQDQLSVPECKTLKISVLSEFMSLDSKSYCFAVSKLRQTWALLWQGKLKGAYYPILKHSHNNCHML